MSLEKTGEISMVDKYLDKLMVWQLQNRTEIIIAVIAFLIGAILF
jgi:hypothetical protein